MPAILFVCKANRIRSPLAAALLEHQLADVAAGRAWHVASAGVWTQTGLPATTEARQVAAEAGLDLYSHRSQRIEELSLARYDLVLTMERNQRDALRAENVALTSQIFTLTEIARGFAYDVADPVGRSLDAHRATFRELDTLVRLTLPRILALSR